jgi:GntR family transcriptional regulator
MCNSTVVIPFTVHFRPGVPLFEQVVYAAQKAMISGQLLPGDPFPSVRALSRELKINPNTAHKIVAQLVNDGLLETRPGIGNVVAARPDSTRKERTQLLTREVEQLVVEAKRLGITRDDILTSIALHWDRLTPEAGPGSSNDQDSTTPDPGGRRKK